MDEQQEKQLDQTEEIVTVEPGQEGLTVEEEIVAETPSEAPEEQQIAEEPKQEEPVEVPTEAPQEEEKKEEQQETASEEESPSPEPEEATKEQEEVEQKPETQKEEKEGAEEVQEPVSTVDDELARVQAELAAMKEAEEVRQMSEAREVAISKAANDFNAFNEKLGNAVLDTFKQYGIDPSMDVEELKKDPAKYQIAQDIMMNAKRLQAEKQAELMKPITEASNKLIFREAGKFMSEFDMTEEQTKVCAETLINIFDATGLANLTDDLKAKVELAVARAKMIAPKVEEVIKDAKEAIKDVAEAKAPDEEEIKETIEEKVKEDKKEPVIKEEKPSLDAFKEGATAEPDTAGPVEAVTKDNVLDLLQRVPFKERAAFFKENQRAIDEAMTEKHKQIGR